MDLLWDNGGVVGRGCRKTVQCPMERGRGISRCVCEMVAFTNAIHSSAVS